MLTTPRINRLILTLTKNSAYTGYWNFVSEIWRTKFDLLPVLIFYGTEEELASCNLSSDYGPIFRLERVPEVTLNTERDWACTWGLFYGATLFPDETCMLCGIDQIPLGPLFFDAVRAVPDWQNKYLIGFGDAYEHKYFPSSQHVALGSKFKEIYSIGDDWPTEVRRVFARRNDYSTVATDAWGLDEAYSSELLLRRMQTHGDVQPLNIFWNTWVPARLERETVVDDNILTRIRSGQCVEWHGRRPFEANSPGVLESIKQSIPVYKWT